MSDSIKVAIKVRPLIRREREDNLAVQWVVQDNSIVSTDPEMKKRGDGGFCFDHIFDMNATNSDVFTTVVKPIVDAAVNGFNGTVFAYGQTSSGKTFTMMGTPDEPGIIPLAVEYMFDAIASTARREFLLRVSYLEIYNERVNDLLNTSNTDLKLKEDSSGQIILLCKEEITNCPENVLSIMKKGNKNKRIGETNMNERSSRSHTIFRITIESREAGGSSEGAIQVSQLNLVDLAGSERARQTGATGERFKEGRHINLSLSTLGLVIMQLSDSQDTQKHVNFRDSKLTRLLQNSLGGNAMTAIICAVTSAALEETQCTLSFASRAKSVKNKPQINEVMSDAALLTRYAKQLSKLQAELEKMKTQNRCAEVEEMETKLQEKDRINQMLEERIEMLKTRIVSGDTTTEETFKSKSKRRQTWGGPGVSNQHLPVFKPTANLPTIRETSFEKPHRKSIIQSADLMNQTFQTAFTDFELELFESERDRVNEETFTDSDEEPFVTKRNTPRVTFRDDVFTIRPKGSTSPEETSIDVTPEKCSMSTQTASYQVSPSTPKHTLRQYISILTNDYKELLEYTTLEKQLLCHENHCCVHEDEVRNKTECGTEVKERLERLNLAGECDIDGIITKLCDKLDEAEAKSRQEMDSNKKKVKQLAELEKQIQNITSEKDEFEYMSRELRAHLKAKTTELDLKNMYEENMKEPEFKRIAELEKQVECLVSEKEKLERVNAELRAESTKEVGKLQKQIEYVTSERDEFQHMRHELRAELNKTLLELEKLKNDPESVREEMIADIKELERQIEDVTSEKSKLERVSAELNDRVLELEATVTSEQTAHRAATEQVSKFQGKIESVTVERNQFERVNTELDHVASELKLKITSLESEAREARGQISELESRIESVTSERNELQRVNTVLESNIVVEETASQNALVKVCELEKQIEGMASEKNKFERLSRELESQIELEQTANKNGMERTSQLEVEIESITSERNELQRVNAELDQKASELESKIAVVQTASQNAMERVSQLEVEIGSVTSEKTEFERINVELSRKIAELESKIAVEKNEIDKVCVLEKQIEGMSSEKNEFERLSEELNRKIAELESQIELERTANKNVMERTSQLEVEIESITSERNELQRVNAELDQKASELESKIAVVQTASQNAMERVSQLEVEIRSVTSEKTEVERINVELSRKIAELESKIAMVQTASQNAMERVSQLEVEIRSVTSEKTEFERINVELSRKIAELESKIAVEKNEIDKVCVLEKQIEGMSSEKNEFERLSEELNRKIAELESQIELERTANKNVMERTSQLEVEIESITSERNELQRINTELDQKDSELKSKIATVQTASQNAMEKVSQLEVEIGSVTSEKTEFERINVELSQKIAELESKIAVERNEMDKVCVLEKQIEGMSSEKNEFEQLSEELNRKIAELESQIELERTANENAMERVSQLEIEIGSVTSEKTEFERLSVELSQKTSELESKIVVEQNVAEKICELEKQIESITSEKNDFERLSEELKRKIAELESQTISEQIASQGAMDKICELEKQIENVISEKNEFERLSGELNRKITELESQMISERTASQNGMEKISQLEVQIESVTSEKNEFERLSGELNLKITELESQMISERTASQNGMEKISQLEVQIESVTSEKNEFERLSGELNRKITELESQMISVRTASQNGMEKISQLEVQIESVTSEKNEFERLSGESQTVSEQAANRNAMERISELSKEIKNLASEKKELERVNSQLRDKLDKKLPESEERSDCDYVNGNSNLNVYIQDLQSTMKIVPIENQDRQDQMEDQSLLLSCSRFNESSADVSSLMVTMEAERNQLEETLHLKSVELDEIKGDVRSLKMDIENLQKAIYLLTAENMDMATKITTEQETAKQAELNLQKTIDELYARISHVTSEKINLESDLASLMDQLESMRSRVPEAQQSEDQLLATYQSKIDKLTEENIELSGSIAEKNKELDNVKESKSLLYDHECIYREKVAVLTREKKSLLVENSELSSDLIDKIEDNDSLKEQCDILKSKVEQSLAMKNHAAGNDAEHLESENNVLKAELAELKRKVAILSDENVKFSSNLLETMESLDSSRNEGPGSNTTLHLSTILNETGQEVVQEETREILAKRVTTLQEKIDHLTRLNKKLSDLKLTSCSQCAHLKNLNESRRALKLETKALNHKLEDLQRKFEQKCADTETLKKQLKHGLNLSAQCVSPNVSFGDEMNVSFVEEKIQSLNVELQALRVDHDKLSLMYEDKCSEHEQLQSGLITDERSLSEDSRGSRRRDRIEQIQRHIDCLRGEVDKLNGNSVNFTAMLDQFKQNEANLAEEINVLRATNEELRQKVSDESTATEKVRILENELTNMNDEIEQFSVREKELETQRLLLEVELEDLKDEKKSKSGLIDRLNQHISSLKNELDSTARQKNEFAASNVTKDKYIEQLEFLKKHCEELEIEQVRSVEIKQRDALRIKELEAYIESLERSIAQHEGLCKDLHERGLHLENLLHESEQEKAQAVETELMKFKANLEIRYKNEFNSMSLQYEHRVEESENNLQKLNDTLNKYVEENLNMTQEVTRLRNIEEKFNAMRDEKERVSSTGKTLSSDNEKLREELNYVRKCMMTELRSLRCDISTADLSNKSVNEIFLIFLQTLLSKEKEVMRTMRETFEKDRQKLVDEKQQSADTEKRATIWAKELEAEIEKLQADLTGRERAQKEYQNKISQLEHLLIESNYEKEILKEKMQGLETDFHNLQTEFDKQCKVDTRQEEAIFVAQKREKEAQETFKNKETELQSTLRLEKEIYEKKISDLAYAIESYKTKNLELNSTIEGLEVNEKQLKNIIEANSAEMRKKNHNIEKLNAELEQLTEAYNEMSREMEQKTLHVKEITVILKNKCDLLSEYQTSLETVMPEYEMLKEHVRDQKTAIERYKEEIETLKKERETQLEIIKDKLNTKEIQNAGLTKQLNELSNRNIALIEELNELKGKYEELQQTNAKLERKIRNSTSKIKAEAEIEKLKELNRRLQTNLEGASNRVAEIQEIKNNTLKELVELQGKHELLSQENNETKKTLASYKSKYSASSLLLDEGKYDALLLEKNRIALELEDKKLLLGQKDKELEECASKIQQLTEKNKEFDNELDEYAAIIQARDDEISKLEDKLYSRLTENTHINELEEKLKGVREGNEKLRDRAEALDIRLQQNMEETRENKAQTEMVIHILKKEKLELQAKLNECKKQLELRLRETSGGQSSSWKKKVENSTEGECNRVTELQDQKNKMVNELVNLKRQYDLLSQENIELKRTLEVYKSKRNVSNLSKDGGKLDSVLRQKNNLAQELEAHKLLLDQKDRELKEYVNRIRDLTSENKEHDTGRDVGRSKLESDSVIDLKEKLRIFREENRMLKNVTRELRLRLNACSERVPLNEESKGNKVGSIVPDKQLGEYKEKCQQLKRQMHELELQLVSKNGKIATLEIQIQSENFPYQRKCKELEEHLLAFRNKNAELNSEVRKLQKAVNDVNTWECEICRRWRVNRKDQACQTIPNDALRFCSTNSGIVGEHLKIQKLEKEKALMKELCRSRSRRVKELETMVKELEEAQSSAVSRQHLLTDKST